MGNSYEIVIAVVKNCNRNQNPNQHF